MSTECYSLIRGSAFRATRLTARGEVPEIVEFVTSKSVVSVQIDEVTEGGANDLLRTEQEDEPRIRFTRATQTIRYDTGIKFLRVDPGVLNLVTNVPLVENALGNVVGFDSQTRLPAAAFALEVWSRLAGNRCADGTPRYGYTLLPFLKGGILSGFVFANGLVSFNLVGARARRSSKWNVGPYDLEGPHERLSATVSRNTMLKSFITTAQPPVQQSGIQTLPDDIIEGGSASSTSADILDGEFVVTSSGIIDGGSAA